MTASESAHAFSVLTEVERDQKITVTHMMLQRICGNSYLRSTTLKFAVELLISGRLSDFESLGDNFWTVWKMWERGVDLDTGFALIALDPNLQPQFFESSRNRNFQNFQHSYDSFTSLFRNAGSERFKRSIHSYFVKYGDVRDERNLVIEESQCDPYLTYAAVILMRKYSEKKVIEVLDRITCEMPLPVLDFINLVKTDQDFSNVTLSWAMEVVSNND